MNFTYFIAKSIDSCMKIKEQSGEKVLIVVISFKLQFKCYNWFQEILWYQIC